MSSKILSSSSSNKIPLHRGVAAPSRLKNRSNFKMTKPLRMKMKEDARKGLASERAAAVGGAVAQAVSPERLLAQREASSRDIRIAAVADALFSRGCSHEATFSNIGFLPMGNPSIPEVAFVGRSRCGMSSLLRALFKSTSAVARGNIPGRRDVINAYCVGGTGAGDYGGGFTVLETPGFGAKVVPWAVVLQHCSLIRSMCLARPSLKMIYYVMDCSESTGLAYRDMDTLKFLAEEIKNFTIVLSKADRNRDMKSIHDQFRFQGIEHPVIATSAFTLGGIDALRFDMVGHCLHSLPTERLSMGEVRRLGERMVSLNQVAIGAAPPRLLHRPMSVTDEEHLKHRQQLLSLEEEEGSKKEDDASAQEQPRPEPKADSLVPPTLYRLPSSSDAVVTSDCSSSNNIRNITESTAASSSSSSSLSSLAGILSLSSRARLPKWMIAPAGTRSSGSKRNSKFLLPPSDNFLRYVSETSPLRNPYQWPQHIALTASKRINVVKVPEDPENPYLFQPRFVVPRADWNFRRPSLKFRKHADTKGRGQYLASAPEYFSRSFTIPFFPDIVDVRLNPQPVAFVGSRTYYDRGNAGKKLALRARSEALTPLIDVTQSSENLLEQPGVKRLGSGLADALKKLDAAVLEKTNNKNQLPLLEEEQQKNLPPPPHDAAADEVEKQPVTEPAAAAAVAAVPFSHPSF